MEILGMPWEAAVALAVSVGGNAWQGFLQFLKAKGEQEAAASQIHTQGWAEVRERDKQIDSLRRLMDRMRTRENAYATACELALLGMKLPPHEQVEIVDRIKSILQAALPPSGGEQ